MSDMVTQFGLIRSGTNLTKALIEANFDVSVCGGDGDFDPRVEGGPWKHGPLTRHVKHGGIYTVRHPLSWLHAVWRYDYQSHLSFHDWLHNGQSSRWRVLPEICLWSFANGYWDRRFRAIRFEDILNAPSQAIRHLARIGGWDQVSGEIHTPADYVGPNESQHGHGLATVQGRELNELYLDEYTKGDIEYVMGYLDPDLMREYGYHDWGTEL